MTLVFFFPDLKIGAYSGSILPCDIDLVPKSTPKGKDFYHLLCLILVIMFFHTLKFPALALVNQRPVWRPCQFEMMFLRVSFTGTYLFQIVIAMLRAHYYNNVIEMANVPVNPQILVEQSVINVLKDLLDFHLVKKK